jgi:hypothetical protein
MKRFLIILFAISLLSASAYPLTVSGTVSGSSGFALIFVLAFPTSLDTFYTTIANPFNGDYTLGGLNEGGYIFFAYQDVDLNLVPGVDEPRGFYGGDIPTVLEVSSDMNGVDIELSPPNTGGFSGEVTYEGGVTGATYIVAHDTPDFSGLPTGAGLLFDNTGNGTYTAFVDSFGTYYAYAYLDANTNLQFDPGEWYDFYGQDDPEPIEIEQGESYPDDVNFTLWPTSASDHAPVLARDFTLGRAYPNPFNAQTTIPFTLANPEHLTLTAYNIQGRASVRIAEGDYPQGAHSVAFDAANLASGFYLIELRSASLSAYTSVYLLK